MAEFGDGKCVLRTRNGTNATTWFPKVTQALKGIEGEPCVVDGQICVFERPGAPRRLQGARRRRWYEGADPVTYAIFDLLIEHGVDITAAPLQRRKAALALLLRQPRPAILPVAVSGKATAQAVKKGRT